MREPFLWSFPIGRVCGITVRVHLLFPLVCLGLILRVATDPKFAPGAWIDMAMITGLLFFTVFLHELGHCFAARRMNGEATEVLLWPLGGLAAVDVPHNPKAHFVTAAGGPLVNVAICLACGVAMAFLLNPGYLPPLNPFWYPFRDASGAVEVMSWGGSAASTTNLAAIALARLFWVSWITFLFNVLLIGFPLDGGRMFQSILWHFLGYRQATQYAIYTGFVVMFLVLLGSLAVNDVLPLFLGLYIYLACRQEWILLETGGEESLFGYDFSQGYTSLERDQQQQPTQTRRKKPNFIQRWLQRRAARKMQLEQEREEADARRMDELLEKIQQHGKESLTDEENRFLKRYAERLKNK